LGPGPDKPPTHGFMEYDAVIADRLEPTIGETCQAAGKRPHIIMVHDESSFDITAEHRLVLVLAGTTLMLKHKRRHSRNVDTSHL
jgi:hypothetical protein